MASALRADDLGFSSCLCHGDFSGLSHTSDLKLAFQWLLCQAPDIGLAQGLVGSVSIYYDWVRQIGRHFDFEGS